MRNRLHFIVSMVSTALVGLVPLPSLAQTLDTNLVFTDQEWQIIGREYSLRGEQPRELLGRVVRRGGSGRTRWVLFNLGEDSFGNQYFLHSNDAQATGEEQWHRYANFIVQVFYKDPAAHNGTHRREVLMRAKCHTNSNAFRAMSPVPSELLEVGIVAYEDIDRNGNSIRSVEVNEALRPAKQGEIYHALVGCDTAHQFPDLIEALVRGMNRTDQPSVYD